MKKLFIIAIAVFSIAANAGAQTVGVNENSNLKGERARVKEGIKNGTITKAEAKRIRKEAKDVKCANRKAKADGVVTKREKANIAKQDRQLDGTIRRAKHNQRNQK